MEQAKPDWKEHPVIVAAAAGSACILFTIAIFSTVVIPTMVKDKELQIAELNKRIEPLEKSVHDSTERVAALPNDLNQLKLRNLELSTENIFSIDDVYPKGFRRVRIGDPTTKIWEAYQKENIQDDKDEQGWISVRVSDELFGNVTYYYAKIKDKNTVTHILFLSRHDFPKQRVVTAALLKERGAETAALLKRQLEEKYGSNKIERVKKEWVLKNVLGHTLKLDEDGGYHVIR